MLRMVISNLGCGVYHTCKNNPFHLTRKETAGLKVSKRKSVDYGNRAETKTQIVEVGKVVLGLAMSHDRKRI